MNEVKDAIRQFILANHLQGESSDNLRDTTRLQSSGILDSLAILGLAAFIEQQFGVVLSVSDVGVDSFDRIEDIAALIARRRASSGGVTVEKNP